MRVDVRNLYGLFLIPLLSLMLAGCPSGGGDGDDSGFAGNPAPPPPASPPPPPPPPPGQNSAPTISGNPAPAVTVGGTYMFVPTASDADGDQLTFSIQNMPSWATFDESTGTLSGTAAAGAEGLYANVIISVSDGSESASLPNFDINVTQVALGSATLSWTAPTLNTDGSNLDDLAGYRIYYGVEPGSYPNQVTIDTAGLTSYVVENLVPNTYYFVTTSINATGVESTFSNMATKVVN